MVQRVSLFSLSILNLQRGPLSGSIGNIPLGGGETEETHTVVLCKTCCPGEGHIPVWALRENVLDSVFLHSFPSFCKEVSLVESLFLEKEPLNIFPLRTQNLCLPASTQAGRLGEEDRAVLHSNHSFVSTSTGNKTFKKMLPPPLA